MKRKNLNTVVKQIFENGEGIPFKEEYWDKMNELLDEHIPVQSAPKQSFSLKHLLFEVTLFSILASGQIVGSFTANTSPEKVIASSFEATQLSSVENTLRNHLSVNENPQLIASTTQNEQAAQLLYSAKIAHTIHNNATAEVTTSTNEKGNIKSNNQDIPFISNENVSNKVNLLIDEPYLRMQTNITFNANQSESILSENQIREMIELVSVTHFQLEPFAYDLSVANPQLIHYPYRHSFIKQIAVLPFLNLTHSNENLIHKEDYTSFVKPAQSSLGGGVSVELILKNIALRTGVGYNTLHLTRLTETIKSNYSYDTSYTIINPIYQTTPSGNPVALIKQQIDSNLQSTNTSTAENQERYQYLSIPLTLQYLIAHKRIQLMAEAGIVNNLIINRTSTVINDTENKKVMLPISNYFPHVTLGAGIRYHMHSNFFIGGQYNLIHSANSQKRSLIQNGHVFAFAAGFYLR